MTEDQREQRRINREFDVESIKSAAGLICAFLLGATVLVAYVVSTKGEANGGSYERTTEERR